MSMIAVGRATEKAHYFGLVAPVLPREMVKGQGRGIGKK